MTKTTTYERVAYSAGERISREARQSNVARAIRGQRATIMAGPGDGSVLLA